MCCVLLCGGAAHAIIASAEFDGSSGWLAVTNPNAPASDFILDQQTGQSDSDIVGLGDQSGFYVNYDDAGTSSLADDYMGFRIRLASTSGKPNEYKGYAFVGIDIGRDGDVDLFVQANTNKIGFYDAGSGTNNSPSSTSISQIEDTDSTDSYYFERHVSDSDFAAHLSFDPVTEFNDANFVSDNLDGGSKGNKDHTDHFLSFQVDVWTLMEAARLASLDDDDQNNTIDAAQHYSYVVLTSTQANSFNQDLNGSDGELVDFNKSEGSWGDLGAVSAGVVLDQGELVPNPEPSSYPLITGLLISTFVVCRRRPRSIA
jgi:hypothetical protein